VKEWEKALGNQIQGASNKTLIGEIKVFTDAPVLSLSWKQVAL
jgi:hypothetical protein